MDSHLGMLAKNEVVPLGRGSPSLHHCVIPSLAWSGGWNSECEIVIREPLAKLGDPTVRCEVSAEKALETRTFGFRLCAIWGVLQEPHVVPEM